MPSHPCFKTKGGKSVHLLKMAPQEIRTSVLILKEDLLNYSRRAMILGSKVKGNIFWAWFWKIKVVLPQKSTLAECPWPERRCELAASVRVGSVILSTHYPTWQPQAIALANWRGFNLSHNGNWTDPLALVWIGWALRFYVRQGRSLKSKWLYLPSNDSNFNLCLK